MGLFTGSDQAAIINSTDTQVKLFILQAAGSSYINLADQTVKQGFDYLVSVGVLTASRETAILANQPYGRSICY
jgi:hypothetical protein